MFNNFNAEQARKNVESNQYTYERMLREILTNTESASRMRFRMSSSSYEDTAENQEILSQVVKELKNRGFGVVLNQVGERIFVEVSF
ncbi:hypothetical protein [Acinetobacter sp. A47]|uniref:hypothetical protein n=1 Tax=Acinetobacter sp. A47 TaxID=1561217 RepID=UPI000570DE8F|nr:hypothetical protein [Acinetobacter sp. A47]